MVVETSNALKSVMTRDDLNDFAIMKKRKRLQTLTTLRKIVCGIMIFNHDAGECGEEIRDSITSQNYVYFFQLIFCYN